MLRPTRSREYQPQRCITTDSKARLSSRGGRRSSGSKSPSATQWVRDQAGSPKTLSPRKKTKLKKKPSFKKRKRKKIWLQGSNGTFGVPPPPRDPAGSRVPGAQPALPRHRLSARVTMAARSPRQLVVAGAARGPAGDSRGLLRPTLGRAAAALLHLHSGARSSRHPKLRPVTFPRKSRPWFPGNPGRGPEVGVG